VSGPIRSIAIVGGGAGAWLAAATLARTLKRGAQDILVVETPAIDEAGEGVVPAIHRLHNLLGLDEGDLMRATQATFKLGAEFCDWGKPGSRYFHAFGTIGARLEAVAFQHYWLKLRQAGDATDFEDYSTAAVAAKLGRFAHPADDKSSVLSLFTYAYHFDCARYARYLRAYAQAHGVVCKARPLLDVKLRGADGFIDALILDDGERVESDLFVDCAQGRLIERAMGTGRVDWRRWLPCDRAVAVSASASSALAPYTRNSASVAGWRCRIPLQQRVDHFYAYCEDFLNEDAAVASLLECLDGEPMSEPRVLRFAPGPPMKFWNKNCVALTQTMAPLEGTGLHLVQTGVTRLLTMFPDRSFNPCDAEEYNRLTIVEHERIRDLLILHFKANVRNEPFWRHCRGMQIPDTLARKLALFEASGRVALRDGEHFGEESWLSVMIGQGIEPRAYDPLADNVDAEAMRRTVQAMAGMIREAANAMPDHAAFIARYCPSAVQ
jgi:tryptophan halogenase